jgi:hypothetical protein
LKVDESLFIVGAECDYDHHQRIVKRPPDRFPLPAPKVLYCSGPVLELNIFHEQDKEQDRSVESQLPSVGSAESVEEV